MKLKTFAKVNTTIKTRYTIHFNDGRELEFENFTVDYVGQDSETLGKNILLRERYGDGKVVNVDAHGGVLTVWVEI